MHPNLFRALRLRSAALRVPTRRFNTFSALRTAQGGNNDLHKYTQEFMHMRDVATSVNKEMRKDAELARLKKELADAQGSSECFGFMLIVLGQASYNLLCLMVAGGML